MIDECDGIIVCCPKCDWEPAGELFLKLSLDRYKRRSSKKLKINCRRYHCDYNGIIEDWLLIYKEFC